MLFFDAATTAWTPDELKELSVKSIPAAILDPRGSADCVALIAVLMTIFLEDRTVLSSRTARRNAAKYWQPLALMPLWLKEFKMGKVAPMRIICRFDEAAEREWSHPHKKNKTKKDIILVEKTEFPGR
jgi:hypothetical protein